MKEVLVLLSLVFLFSCVPPGDAGNAWTPDVGDLPEVTFDGSRSAYFISGKLPPAFSEGAPGVPGVMTQTMQTTIHYTYAVGFVGESNAVAYIDNDEVLVGGGALVYYSGGATALLTASYPLISGTRGLAWVAQSKNRVNPSSQTLIAFAIGLKLNDVKRQYGNGLFVPAAELQKYVKYTLAVSACLQYPSATARVPNGYDVIAGGGFTFDPYTESDAAVSSFLTTSYPNIEEYTATEGDNWGAGWTMSAKSHYEYRPACIAAYAISIPQNRSQDNAIPGYGDIRVCYRYARGAEMSVPVNSPSAPQQLTIVDTFGGLLTGIGGKSEYTGNGRMLTALQPLANKNAIIRDTFETGGSGGTLYGRGIWIQYDDAAN